MKKREFRLEALKHLIRESEQKKLYYEEERADEGHLEGKVRNVEVEFGLEDDGETVVTFEANADCKITEDDSDWLTEGNRDNVNETIEIQCIGAMFDGEEMDLTDEEKSELEEEAEEQIFIQ